MDHTVAGLDINRNDGGLIHCHGAVFDADGDVLAFQSLDVTGGDIGRRHFGAEHVVCENSGQDVNILWQEQRLDEAVRQCGKRLVRRCEHCERTLA